jgi:hypothetical protein
MFQVSKERYQPYLNLFYLLKREQLFDPQNSSKLGVHLGPLNQYQAAAPNIQSRDCLVLGSWDQRGAKGKSSGPARDQKRMDGRMDGHWLNIA